MEHLNLIYEQCNEHLREVDKKRDQILVFFTAVIALFMGNLDKLDKNTIIVTFLILSMSGTFLLFVLKHYRLWHLKYTLSCQVIQTLMTNSTNISYEMIEQILNKLFTKPTNHRYLCSSETLIINLFAIINSINLYICINTFINVIKIQNSNLISFAITIIINITIIIVINKNIYKEICSFYNAPNKVKHIWILNFCTNDYNTSLTSKEAEAIQNANR